MARLGRSSPIGAFFWRGQTTNFTFLGETNLQAIATQTADARLEAVGEVLAQAVGVVSADAELAPTPEAILIAVATVDALGGHPLEGEAELVGVAHMGFDPQLTHPRTTGVVVARGSFYAAPNRRRVRTASEVASRTRTPLPRRNGSGAPSPREVDAMLLAIV